MIRSKFISKEITYDGSQLSSLYAFKEHNLQGDSIISFVGPCRVALDKMVDMLDVMNNETIFSHKMLHFIVEHFDLDLEKSVLRQRTLIMIIKEKLQEVTGKVLKRNGDDLYFESLKLSVSIATLSPVSGMIHVGLNIESRETPIPTVSLTELGVTDAILFAETVMRAYTGEMESIYMARCKVRGVN